MKIRRHTLISGMILVGLTLASPALLAQDHSQHEQQQANSQQNTGDRDGMMNRDGRGGGGGGMMNRDGQNAGMDHGDEEGGMGGGMGGGMMMQRMQNMHNNMHAGDATSGQSAFDLISAVVDQLEANPDTDWANVNIEALRQHLVDMNQVTLYAEVESAAIDGGARYEITGDGRTRDAIKRMVPTHATQIEGEIGWNASTETIRQGVVLTVTSEDPAEIARIRGLGFLGFMVQGEHHDDHHLLLAGGQPAADHDGMDHAAMNHGDMDHDSQGGDHSGH